jgi:hypothetical protein
MSENEIPHKRDDKHSLKRLPELKAVPVTFTPATGIFTQEEDAEKNPGRSFISKGFSCSDDSSSKNYFFLCLFFLRRFLRLCVAILCLFLFLPLGMGQNVLMVTY